MKNFLKYFFYFIFGSLAWYFLSGVILYLLPIPEESFSNEESKGYPYISLATSFIFVFPFIFILFPIYISTKRIKKNIFRIPIKILIIILIIIFILFIPFITVSDLALGP